MLLDDLFFTPFVTGERTLHGIGDQLQQTVGESPVTCMIHGTEQTQDVHAMALMHLIAYYLAFT